MYYFMYRYLIYIYLRNFVQNILCLLFRYNDELALVFMSCNLINIMFRYNDELALVFMSCNLIGGMFQRLEKLKKHAFASVCLFGKDNDSSISGRFKLFLMETH